MATLNNPISTQNIVDRFADYVTATANASIVWGTNARPFGEFVAGNMPGATPALPNAEPFGGDTSGRAIGINGSSINATPITASTIYNTLVTETNAYTRLRRLQARLNVTGGGGNTGSRPTAGIVFDQTNKANMNTSFLQSVGSPANAGVASGQTISASGLESFFTNLQTAYGTARDTTFTITVNVCHASCHSSCHGSRGRR